MTQALDQIFVIAKHSILTHVPAVAQPIASAILSVVPILIAFPLLFAITTVLERKGLGRIQNRYGPNRTGPAGFFSAHRRRHQVADKGRSRSAQRRTTPSISSRRFFWSLRRSWPMP